MKRRKRLGEILVDSGLLTQAKLEEIIAAQRESGMRLGKFVIEKGLLSEREIVNALAQQLRIQRFLADDFPVDQDLAALLTPAVAARTQMIPLRKDEGILYVAMPDPTDLLAMDQLQEKLQLEVEPVICTSEEFNELMGTLYGMATEDGGIPQQIEEVSFNTESEEKDEAKDSATTTEPNDAAAGQAAVRTFNWIITQAVRQNASDVHLSPEKNRLRVRFRMDGNLKDLPSLPKSMQQSVISRIKILAGMDISVSRAPQDGRFSVRLAEREINVRVSSLPTVHGENLVLRLLGTQSQVLQLEQLGLSPGSIAFLHRLIQRPNGMLLSTGPTGSGKTTLLYSLLALLNQPDVNIVTVEDPVESRIDNIRQVELNARAGMTFASSLRSILRQDPDTIMVGEIRDQETARIAVQASLTGHFVLSTMHTNDAVGTVNRIIDMGVEPFLIASVLKGVVAQRLIRRVCNACAQPLQPEPAALSYWKIDPHADVGKLRKAKGCRLCNDSGYKGRIGIFESLEVNETISSAVLRRAAEAELLQIAEAQGKFTSMLTDARDKILAGITTMEEAATIVAV